MWACIIYVSLFQQFQRSVNSSYNKIRGYLRVTDIVVVKQWEESSNGTVIYYVMKDIIEAAYGKEKGPISMECFVVFRMYKTL